MKRINLTIEPTIMDRAQHVAAKAGNGERYQSVSHLMRVALLERIESEERELRDRTATR